ncbi:MAG: 3-dehydroquinate synthase II [Thermoplasmata archaeon]
MSHPRVVLTPTSHDLAEVEALIARAARRGFDRFLLDQEMIARMPSPPAHWMSRDSGMLRRGPGLPSIPIVEVDDPKEVGPALARLHAGDPVAVRWKRERVIPLETLVAARRQPGTLWVITDRPSDLPGFLGALEHGADEVVVEIAHAGMLDELEAYLDRAELSLEWASFPIRRVVSAGMGDRVIVDTTSLLAPDEGLLVGSSAAVLLHVASEAIGSRYTRPRPFRVNAGAAHLYTLLAGGETRYLSELSAGDPVLIARPNGPARSVRVGRIKIERRPMTLIEIEEQGRGFTTFLQEAETVRVSTTQGPVATTDIAPGASIWGIRAPAARHLGVEIHESIEER